MKMFKITYVSFIYTRNGRDFEKIKEFTVNAVTKEDAKFQFLAKNVKHKSIKKIEENIENNLGNMFPELYELKEQLNKRF